MADLVKRLRKHGGNGFAIGTEAANEIERLQQDRATLIKALSHIKWVKDCGIDSVNSKGKLVNYPKEERDTMYTIADTAIREVEGPPNG